MRYVASPNRDERPAGTPVSLIVIHAISLPPGEFGGPGIEELFTNRVDPAGHPYYQTISGLRVSAHFLIRRDGVLVQFVPCGERAWHAGESSWKGRARCNDFSIGIELEGTDDAPFENAQYEMLVALTRALMARYPIEDLAGHSEVAPGRKTDPGPHFDWERYRATAGPVEIGRAAPEDYAGILELQAANFAPNLTPQERESGFLSAEFTLPQIAAIAGDLGILVARDAGRVVAYLCAHRIDMTPLPPLIEAMIRCGRAASYRGRALAHARLFVYGPVCIARAHRGRGLMRGLYRAVLTEMRGKFEFGVTLVSDDNPHSLRAHVDGLGMDDAQRFDHGGRRYHLLAFAVQ